MKAHFTADRWALLGSARVGSDLHGFGTIPRLPKRHSSASHLDIWRLHSPPTQSSLFGNKLCKRRHWLQTKRAKSTSIGQFLTPSDRRITTTATSRKRQWCDFNNLAKATGFSTVSSRTRVLHVAFVLESRGRSQNEVTGKSRLLQTRHED